MVTPLGLDDDELGSSIGPVSSRYQAQPVDHHYAPDPSAVPADQQQTATAAAAAAARSSRLVPFMVSPETFSDDIERAKQDAVYAQITATGGDEDSDANGGIPWSKMSVAEMFVKVSSMVLLKSAVSAMGTPFEVMTTLKQVQHVPYPEPSANPSESNTYVVVETSESHETATAAEAGLQRDEFGYLVGDVSTEKSGSSAARSHHRRSTAPVSGEPLQPLVGNSWKVARQIGAHPDEGYSALWKGHNTAVAYSTLHDIAASLIMPALYAISSRFSSHNANVYADFYDGPAYDRSETTITMATELITGVLLSPLEIIKTRMIVQSGNPTLRKYDGVSDALSQIIHEEGGISALYFDPRNLMPTLLFYTIDPFFDHSLPLVLDACGASFTTAEEAPILYNLVDLAWSTLQLVIVLPILTARRRIMAQPQYRPSRSAFASSSSSSSSLTVGVVNTATAAQSPNTGRLSSPFSAFFSASKRRTSSHMEFYTCVRMSPMPYTGIWQTIYRIATEEMDLTPFGKASSALGVHGKHNGSNSSGDKSSGRRHHRRRASFNPADSTTSAANSVSPSLSPLSSESPSPEQTDEVKSAVTKPRLQKKHDRIVPLASDGWKRLYEGFWVQSAINAGIAVTNIVLSVLAASANQDL